MVGLYSAFHFTTLEEYYCGTLYLGPLNGVSDGSLIIVILTFITGCFGNNFWATPAIGIEWLVVPGVPKLTYGQIFALCIGVLNYFDSIYK